ncbi:succinyl-diaminopimelate desuccinylase [Haloprofundus marisrubri]|uniref:Succinyl-diaminopimelate desuccinylase n=1 Tax=Haloprofundus marisrubri TaxID=1514971 RepID=A0A0W1R8X5_9EURY|nr:M20 family metallopeptidase [Haloprofundus marisrubri]KTG09896.1 succinyl-diaminopimelate desuccinylase [Haloprofundus marisrubri]
MSGDLSDESEASEESGASEKFDPIDFLDRAVRVKSHEDVSAMRELLVETVESRGIDTIVDDAGNTLASRGEGSPHVVLNTHIDTVSPHVDYEREGSGDDEVIRGRGACDAKGPLAALLAGFFATDPHEGTLTLAVTPDEEVLSTGAHALNLDGDAYIVGEPTGLDVCTAAKGRFEGIIELSGENAHAAESESGANAVAAAEGALEAIRTYDAVSDTSPPTHEQLGAPSLTPTVISGGEATNQVPDRCSITVDRRSVPPETAREFREALEAHVRAHVADDVGVEFALTERETPFLEAFSTEPDHELVRTLADASGDVVRPFTAATEASYFSPAPTVVFGPGVLADDEGPVAHADREYVRVSEVRAAADSVTETLQSLVGEDG